MKSLENVYGFNEEKAKGLWFCINDKIRVKLAYSHSPNVEAKVQAERERKEISLGRKLKEEEYEEVGTTVFVDNVLLDWEFPEGEECTRENKLKALKEYPKFIQACIAISQDNKNYQEQNIDETVGN